MSTAYVGQRLAIRAGKQIVVNGTPQRKSRDAIVTVRKVTPARNGKTRVFWKSNGYQASALV